MNKMRLLPQAIVFTLLFLVNRTFWCKFVFKILLILLLLLIYQNKKGK